MCNTAIFFLCTTILFLGSTLAQTRALYKYKNSKPQPKPKSFEDNMREDFDRIIINFE